MKANKRALIVEADPGLRLLLQRIFKGRLFDADVAESIEEIPLILEKQGFDLVLVNWTDTWSRRQGLLRQVCGDYPDTVIVTRLSAKPDLAVELLRAGACDCLLEPLGLAELVDVCETALEKRFLRLAGWYDQSVMAIAAAIRLRDVETVEHCQRVANTTVRLCRALGLNRDSQLRSIRWGAFLHDVGKVGLPDSILHKEGPLDAEENRQMRRHPQVGKELLERIPFLEDSIPLVLYHHERYDGLGYPEGLKADRIPLAARAIAVADTVDAMVSNRPYRPALSWDQVLAELADNRGGQFDPDVVDVALRHQEDVFCDYLGCRSTEGVLC